MKTKIDPTDTRPFFSGKCERCMYCDKEAYDKSVHDPEWCWECTKRQRPRSRISFESCWRIESCTDFREPIIIPPERLRGTVYVVIARFGNAEKDKIYYAAKTEFDVSLNSNINVATLFKSESEAESCKSELENANKNTYVAFAVRSIPKFVFGDGPSNIGCGIIDEWNW